MLTSPAISLAQAKERAGFLYVPSYVPPGFELFRYRAGPGIVSLAYVSRDTTIRIGQQKRALTPYVKTGYVEQISLSDRPAYVVRGMWAFGKWDPTTGVAIIFQAGDTVFDVWAPAQSIESELIKVAESMEPYEE